MIAHPSFEPIATMFDELRQGIRQVDCEHFTGKKEEEKEDYSVESSNSEVSSLSHITSSSNNDGTH
jgi:hypothetical protein